MNIIKTSKSFIRQIKEDKYFWFIAFFFLSLYSLISIVNHINFRTFALDLGAYTNALWDYAHFQFNDSTAFKEIPENLLADHFDLYLVLFSPFIYLFGTYTLLIIQIIFIGIGGLGIYKIFKEKNVKIALFASLNFFLFFGIYSSISFDYHSNVIAAMLIPWFIFYFRKEQFYTAFVVLILILVSKENIALWTFFIGLGLLVEYRKNSRQLKFLIFTCLLSVIYYIAITKYIMPAFSNTGHYPHFKYSVLGNDESQAITNLFTHPVDLFKVLFTNHTQHPFGDYVKAELHVFLFISGLLFLVFKPNYFLMLIPIYFQKLFSDNLDFWGITNHYSIEFAPIITIGAFLVISKIKNKTYHNVLSVFLIFCTLLVTVRLMDHTIMYTQKSKIRFYQKSHYNKEYNIEKVYEVFKMIPENAIVSAQSPFLPHLSLRNSIYQFPTIRDAEYIIISDLEITYPIQKEDFNKIKEELLSSNEWTIIAKENEYTLLRRK